MKFGIIKSGNNKYYERWIKSCKNLEVDYIIIDLFINDWLSQLKNQKLDCLLLRPPGSIEQEKMLFDERLYVISKILSIPTYPSFEEIRVYENKKILADFLKASKLPHPQTKVFVDIADAKIYINNCIFPIVAKTSIGASGSGVKFFNNKKNTLQYLNKAFSGRGVRKRFGPNRSGSVGKWLWKAIKSPKYFMHKMQEYISVYKSVQKGYVIFQEYVQHDFEWRGIRIGDSFFVHKKIKNNKMASGSKGIEYVNPSTDVLDFIYNISEKIQFNTFAVDFFEDNKGKFLINEIQTIFGHVQNHICEVNNEKGRFIRNKNKWEFEKGDFNSNESYDLRLKHAMKLYSKDNL